MVEWKNTVWTYLDCLRGNNIIIFFVTNTLQSNSF